MLDAALAQGRIKFPSPRFCKMSIMIITPHKAAQIAGLSRRSIMRAIERKSLRAIQNARHHWEISEDDLRCWQAHHLPVAGAAIPSPEASLGESQGIEFVASVADAAAQVAHLQARLEEAQADRNHWREVATRLSKTLERLSPL